MPQSIIELSSQIIVLTNIDNIPDFVFQQPRPMLARFPMGMPMSMASMMQGPPAMIHGPAMLRPGHHMPGLTGPPLNMGMMRPPPMGIHPGTVNQCRFYSIPLPV